MEGNKMKIIDKNNISELKKQKNIIILGNFDGIHLGHQELIKRGIECAENTEYKTILYTFKTHTNNNIKLLTNNEEKLLLLKEFDLDYIYFEEFDEVKNLSPEEFIHDIIMDRLHSDKVICGFDFTFSKNKSGNTELLKKLGLENDIKVVVIDSVKDQDGEVISSTRVRKYIEEGNIEKAGKLLGHYPIIAGEVVHGRKMARQMGFPTANLIFENKVYPPFGVYGVYVKIDGEKTIYNGVMNLGKNPTLKPGELSVEVHILDFNRFIYGKKIIIYVLEKVSDEIKFNEIDQLVEKIGNDVKYWKKKVKDEYGDTNKIRKF